MIGMRYKTIKHIIKSFKYNKFSSIGISAMILFISMVLVAGIAASVLLQTSSSLESQGIKTGRETRDEVSTDIDVIQIFGHYNTRTIGGSSYTRYHNMSIMVTPRGASLIDLSQVFIEISNGDNMLILKWDNTKFASQSSGNGIFSTPEVFNLTATSFGIVLIEDADGSCISSRPVINQGDKVIITVNLSACFNGLQHRTDVEGMIIPEFGGSPGVFRFRVPKTGSAAVVEFL
jgi:flagellin FlaB